jgi:methylthioribose-1-phosphate isomerase
VDILSRLGFSSIRWAKDRLLILDQRQLPLKEDYRELRSVEEVSEAISTLAIRGAPLIGIAAAYGLCLLPELSNTEEFKKACDLLKFTRPTAANLSWAIDRMVSKLSEYIARDDLREIMIEEASGIHGEDELMCERMGAFGNEIVPDPCRILTHCNAGALATGGIGTALGVIYTAFFSGKRVEVWVDETRPVLQGARLTAWELSKAKIPYKLISDNMAGHLMSAGQVDLVITGADRVAENLDFANKIGTYTLAVLARHHNIPFYSVAPSTTFDSNCSDGQSITIEMRGDDEIKQIGGFQIAPQDCQAYNPAFDITPHELVSGIITDRGILKP